MAGKVELEKFNPRLSKGPLDRTSKYTYKIRQPSEPDKDVCPVEQDVSKILDQFETLVISYITDFLNIQQVYDPDGLKPCTNPRAFNMDRKLELMSTLLKQFDPETQKLLEIQVLNEIQTEQYNFNQIKGNPCTKPLAEVQELVLQFQSEVRQSSRQASAVSRRGRKGKELIENPPCPPPNYSYRTSRLSKLISNLKRCLTYQDPAGWFDWFDFFLYYLAFCVYLFRSHFHQPQAFEFSLD